MEPPLPRSSKRCVRIQLITAPMREKMDGGWFWSRSAKTDDAYTWWRSFSACCESTWHTDPAGSASVWTIRSRRCLPTAISGGDALSAAMIGERSALDDGARACGLRDVVSAAAGCAGDGGQRVVSSAEEHEVLRASRRSTQPATGDASSHPGMSARHRQRTRRAGASQRPREHLDVEAFFADADVVVQQRHADVRDRADEDRRDSTRHLVEDERVVRERTPIRASRKWRRRPTR